MKNSFLFTLSIIFIGTMFSCSEKKENQNMNSEDEMFQLLEPPIKDVNIPFETFLVNPLKDTILYDQSGSKIQIPKNAFLNAKGEVITTAVNVSF